MPCTEKEIHEVEALLDTLCEMSVSDSSVNEFSILITNEEMSRSFSQFNDEQKELTISLLSIVDAPSALFQKITQKGCKEQILFEAIFCGALERATGETPTRTLRKLYIAPSSHDICELEAVLKNLDVLENNFAQRDAFRFQKCKAKFGQERMLCYIQDQKDMIREKRDLCLKNLANPDDKADKFAGLRSDALGHLSSHGILSDPRIKSKGIESPSLSSIDIRTPIGFFFQGPLFEKQKKQEHSRQGLFEIVSHHNVTPEEAMAALDEMIGRDEAKKMLLTKKKLAIYALARARVTGKNPTQDGFENIILEGPPGVGKTTIARNLGAIFSANDLIKEKRTTIVIAKNLVGRFVGAAQDNVNQLIQTGRGGVIVIDELDRLANDENTRFDKEVIDALNAGIDNELKCGTGTIFVLTGYAHGIDDLMRSNEGLARRFPKRFRLEPYTDTELKMILRARAAKDGYKITNAAMAKIMNDVARDRNVEGKAFGNAQTMIEIFHKLVEAKAQKFDDAYLHDLMNGKGPQEDFLAQTSSLGIDVVPTFDSKTKSFKVAELAPPHRKSPRKGKLLRFPQTNKPSQNG